MWPEETVEIVVRGYGRIGRFVEADEKNGVALYVFTGDAIAGPSFEIWLTPHEVTDKEALKRAYFADEVDSQYEEFDEQP